MNKPLQPWKVLCLCAAVALAMSGAPKGCDWKLPDWVPVVVPATRPTAAMYTYEKDSGSVPAPVLAAMSTLNSQGIIATNDEVDTTDGVSEVPDQYKVSRPAAVKAGLPALVVMGGDKVLRVVKSPTTEAAVLEAAK